MTLGNFLKVVDKDTFLYVEMYIHGMLFETRHSAEFFVNEGNDINFLKVREVCVNKSGMHVRLE